MTNTHETEDHSDLTPIVDEYGEITGYRTPEFVVHDQKTAEWVLSKMQDAQAAIDAVDGNKEVLLARSILANAEDLKKRHQKKLDWLHQRFDAELGEYAKTQFPKGEKTYRAIYGSVSLRVKKGGLRVADKELAVAWAKEFMVDAVKITEEFQISKLTPNIRITLENQVSHGRYPAFLIEPDSETITVRTSVD